MNHKTLSRSELKALAKKKGYTVTKLAGIHCVVVDGRTHPLIESYVRDLPWLVPQVPVVPEALEAQEPVDE